MAIRLRKNFRRFYLRRLLKSKIRRFNKFLAIYNKKKNKKLTFRIKKRKIRRRRLTLYTRSILIQRLYVSGYRKRYFFRYLKGRLEFIRLKKFISKHKWYNKKRIWKRGYRKSFKILYLNFCKNKTFKVRHFKIASRFYKSRGLYRFLKDIVKYSRLKFLLSRYGKQPIKKSKKKIIRKASFERVEKFLLVHNLFQNLISAGKKKLSLRIFFDLFSLLKFKYKNAFIDNYLEGLENIRPLIKYKVMYIGGKKYRIPALMPISKSYLVAIRWLILNSSTSGHITIAILNNLNSSIKNEGSIVKFRKEYHLASFENKSYIRFLKFLKSGF